MGQRPCGALGPEDKLSYANTYDRHIGPLLGDVPLRELDAEVIAAFQGELLADQTQRHRLVDCVRPYLGRSLRTYGHVIEELEDAPQLPAEEAIRQARGDAAGATRDLTRAREKREPAPSTRAGPQSQASGTGR